MKNNGTISLLNRLHKFYKTNLTTLRDKTGSYDSWKCVKCGIEGKRYGLSNSLQLSKKYSETTKKCCVNYTDTFKGNKIIIIEVNVLSIQFKNLLPNSIHKIITPPENEINGDIGVWIMGVSEPVQILFDEFTFKPKLKRTKPPIN